MSEIDRCRKCGRTIAQSLSCGYCYALVNRPVEAQPEREYSDLSEYDFQEACNPNEGDKA